MVGLRAWSALLVLPCFVQAQPQLSLGMYGALTSRDMRFAAAAVAFDLDFRKNFEPDLVARFGPPIVAIPDLHPNLRVKLQLCDSASDLEMGMRCALNLFQGINGYETIVGLVGGLHSAISMPVSSMASLFRVTQICWGSTSPKLSDKAAYPYFLRTIPPDSIQGIAMWTFIPHFLVPSVTFMFSQEAYGEGLFQAVVDKATEQGQTFRVSGVGITYMPGAGKYDVDLVKAKIALTKSIGVKTLFVAMTSDQGGQFLDVAIAEGLTSASYQMVCSQAMPAILRPGLLPVGYTNFQPINQGPLYTRFEEMWRLLTVDDVQSPEHEALYKIDKFEAPISRAVIPLTNASFSRTDNLPLHEGFIFDALYTFVLVANEMLNAGVALENISGPALLAKVKAASFEGISGRVVFDANGDRAASYNIMNLQPGDQVVNVAVFSAITGEITRVPGEQLYWMCGTTGWTIPDRYASCEPGYWKDSVGPYATLLCLACEPGTISAGGIVTECEACPAGQMSNMERGATSCSICDPGTFAEVKSTTCSRCPAGQFTDQAGQTTCQRCAVGSYSSTQGATACELCAVAKPRPELYSTLKQVSVNGVAEWVPFEAATGNQSCGCRKGSYEWGGECVFCTEGMQCPGMGEVLIQSGFFATPDEPGSVFSCRQNVARCPGGPPGTCAEGRLVTSIACAECEPGTKPSENGKCAPCAGADFLPMIGAIAASILGMFALYRLTDISNPAAQSKAILLVTLAASQMVTTLQHLGVFTTFRFEWQAPFTQILAFLGIFSFKLDYFSPNCIATVDPVAQFAVRIFIMLAFFGFIFLIHLSSVLIWYRKRCRSRMPALIGSVGTIFSAFFISVVSSMLAPFQCEDHPNGLMTVRDYPVVTCWDNHRYAHRGHDAMIAMGLVASLIPLAFLSMTTWVVWKLPSKLANGDTKFLNSFRFLFFRFRHGAHWYILVFLVRNLLIAVIPAIGSVVLQLLLLMSLMLPLLVLTVYVRPWTLALANLLDATNTACLCVLLFMFSLFTEGVDGLIVANLCVAIVVFAFGSVLIVTACGAYERFGRSGKPFQFFLSHHKAGAGNLARLLKLFLVDSSAVKGKVFLDSDNLRDLGDLFRVVGCDTETLVVLCSKEFLLRPWCVGEVATAHLYQVRVQTLIFDCFEWPDEDFILQYEQHVPDVVTLSNFSISLAMVQSSLRWLQERPCIALPSQLEYRMLGEISNCIVAWQREGRGRGKRPPLHHSGTLHVLAVDEAGTPTSNMRPLGSAHPPNCIIANMFSIEAAASAFVLQKLLRKISPIDLVPLVLPHTCTALSTGFKQACLLCDGGALRSSFVVTLVMRAVEADLAILPVVCDSSFRFPTQRYRRSLAESSEELLKEAGFTCGGKAFARAVMRIFEEIAVEFNSQDAEGAICIRARAVRDRLAGNLRSHTNRMTSFGSTLSPTSPQNGSLPTVLSQRSSSPRRVLSKQSQESKALDGEVKIWIGEEFAAGDEAGEGEVAAVPAEDG